jgi:hypothetical protein
MKKLLILLAVTSLGFVSCNNDSTTDADAEAKRIADSTRVADSLAKVSMEAVPTAEQLEAKRIADSTHVADSLKKAAGK